MIVVNPDHASGARWTATPLIIFSETYTDNVALTPPGLEEKEQITELTPGLLIHGEGTNSVVDIDMRWQYLTFEEDSDRNTTNFKFLSDGVIELSPEAVFLDFEARRNQEAISTADPLPIDSISDTTNLADVSQYSISPRLEKRYGSYAQLSANYRYGEVDYERETESDAVIQSVALNSSGGDDPIFNWRWLIDFSAVATQREGQRDDEREEGSAELARWINPKLLGLIRAGYVDDEVGDISGFDNGSYWAAGLEWHPIDRMEMRILLGNRDSEVGLRYETLSRKTEVELNWRDLEVGSNSVIGSRFNGVVRHRADRLSWQARYIEETTNEQIVRLLNGQQANGSPLEDPVTGDPLTPEENLFGVTSASFIRTRWVLSTGYEAPRSALGFGIFEEERESTATSEQEKVKGLELSWRWRFKPFTSLLLRSSARRNEFDDGREDDLTRYDMGVLHEFDRGLDGSLVYRRADRESTDPTAVFIEHRLTLRAEKRF